MIRLRKKSLRVFAGIVSLLFLSNNAAWGVPLSSGPGAKIESLDPKQITIPSSLAEIQEIYTPEKNPRRDSPLVIFIQDIHASVNVQKDIAQLIDYLAGRYGFDFVAYEGNEGPIETRKIFWFPDRELRKACADHFLGKLLISGPEYAHINSRVPFRLYGMEDYSAYERNLRVFQNALRVRQDALNVIKMLERELKRGFEKKASSKAKELFQLEWNYQEGRIELSEYFKKLIQILEKEKISSSHLVQVSSLIRPEKKRAADKEEKIKSKDFFDELRELEGLAESELFRSREEKEIRYALENLKILKDMASFSATREELDRFWSSRSDFEEIFFINLIKKTQGEKTLKIPYAGFLDDLLEDIALFYEIARQRDDILARNLLQSLKKEKAALFVAGGFHTPGIMETLRKKGVSFMVLTPRYGGEEKGSKRAYFDSVLEASSGDERSASRLFQNSFRSPDLFNEARRNPGLVKNKVEKVAAALAKSLGKDQPDEDWVLKESLILPPNSNIKGEFEFFKTYKGAPADHIRSEYRRDIDEIPPLLQGMHPEYETVGVNAGGELVFDKIKDAERREKSRKEFEAAIDNALTRLVPDLLKRLVEQNPENYEMWNAPTQIFKMSSGKIMSTIRFSVRIISKPAAFGIEERKLKHDYDDKGRELPKEFWRLVKIDFQLVKFPSIAMALITETLYGYYLRYLSDKAALKLYTVLNALRYLAKADDESKKELRTRLLGGQERRSHTWAFLTRIWERSPSGGKIGFEEFAARLKDQESREMLFEAFEEMWHEGVPEIERLRGMEPDELFGLLKRIDDYRKSMGKTDRLLKPYENARHHDKKMESYRRILNEVSEIQLFDILSFLAQWELSSLIANIAEIRGIENVVKWLFISADPQKSLLVLTPQQVARALRDLRQLGRLIFISSRTERIYFGEKIDALVESFSKEGNPGYDSFPRDIMFEIAQAYWASVRGSSLGTPSPVRLDSPKQLIVQIKPNDIDPSFFGVMRNAVGKDPNRKITLILPGREEIRRARETLKSGGFSVEQMDQIKFEANKLITPKDVESLRSYIEGVKTKMSLGKTKAEVTERSANDIALIADYDVLLRLNHPLVIALARDKAKQREGRDTVNISYHRGRKRAAAAVTLCDLAWDILARGDLQGFMDRAEREASTGIFLIQFEYLRSSLQRLLAERELTKRFSMAA